MANKLVSVLNYFFELSLLDKRDERNGKHEKTLFGLIASIYTQQMILNNNDVSPTRLVENICD